MVNTVVLNYSVIVMLTLLVELFISVIIVQCYLRQLYSIKRVLEYLGGHIMFNRLLVTNYYKSVQILCSLIKWFPTV
jgi:hypothetical protein